MKKRFISLTAALALFALPFLQAQTDITTTYLTNPGFDESGDFSIQDQGTADPSNVGTVTGWPVKNIGGWGVSYVYELGSSYLFNAASVPSTDKNGETSGGILAVSVGWGNTLSFAQAVTLPVGKYRIEYDVYNSGTATVGASAVGFVPYIGTSTLSTKNSFAIGQWETDAVEFIISVPTAGEIQIGLISQNAGSGSNAKLCFDNVKLYQINEYPIQLINAVGLLTENLICGTNPGIDEVWTNMNLVTSIGEGVSVTWTSSKPEVISTSGVVVTPEYFDIAVTLTAKLSYTENGTEYTLEKEFKVKVVADGTIYTIAAWNFADATYNSDLNKIVLTSTGTEGSIPYTGTFENGASKRTIGDGNNTFTVIDLGNNNGYFDMGKEIGEMIYNLSDNFSIGGYFLVEEDAVNATSNGNFLCSFSNSAQSATDKNGSIFIRPWACTYSITTGRWDSGDRAQVASSGYFVDAAQGVGEQLPYRATWHHIFYTQIGTKGALYVNGELVVEGESVNVFPANLRIDGRQGTDYNFLGRSQYADNGDAYLNKSLLYDFQILGYGGVAPGDIDENLTAVLANLNNAYAINPGSSISNTLEEAAELVTIPSGITGSEIQVGQSLTLSNSVEGYPTIIVKWSASNPDLMDANGNFTHHFYDSELSTLIATVVDTETGQSIIKEFPVYLLVLANEAPKQTETGMLLHFDFDNTTVDKVNGIAGELVNSARIRTIGEEENSFNVLDLGSDNGYFDMTGKAGEIVAHLEDAYTISAYYYIEEDNAQLTSGGNFLWTFANSSNIAVDKNGYFMFSAGAQRVEMSSETYNTTGILNLPIERDENDAYIPSTKGEWYFVAITGEEFFVGYHMYRTDSISGDLVILENTADVAKNPMMDLLKEDKVGTNYNWIGRSCFSGDKYLGETLVYDFRVYNQTKTALDFEGAEYGDVMATLLALSEAYKQNPDQNPSSSLEDVTVEAPYQIYAFGNAIKVLGLQGNEKIALYDITGRQYVVNNPQEIAIGHAGVYILRINNYATKVIVR